MNEMSKILIIAMGMLFLSSCFRSSHYKIKKFRDAMDQTVGTVMTEDKLKYYRELWQISSENISKDTVRYRIKMDNPATSGGRHCLVYQDVNIHSKKIVRWGYLSSPDKCSIRIDWVH